MNPRVILIIVILLAIGAIVGGVYYQFQNNVEARKQELEDKNRQLVEEEAERERERILREEELAREEEERKRKEQKEIDGFTPSTHTTSRSQFDEAALPDTVVPTSDLPFLAAVGKLDDLVVSNQLTMHGNLIATGTCNAGVLDVANKITLISTDQEMSGAYLAIKEFVDGIRQYPVGTILPVHNVTSLPAGWFVCDGKNRTPDLRGMFVKGSVSDGSDRGTTGGQESVTLTEDHILKHNHGGTTAAASNVSTAITTRDVHKHQGYFGEAVSLRSDTRRGHGHGHGLLVGADQDTTHNGLHQAWKDSGSHQNDWFRPLTRANMEAIGQTFKEVADHTHTFNLNHGHTCNSAGSKTPTPIPTIPPYVGLVYVMRVK
jgi:hypothetical protein